jgi:hypothetical protein
VRSPSKKTKTYFCNISSKRGYALKLDVIVTARGLVRCVGRSHWGGEVDVNMAKLSFTPRQLRDQVADGGYQGLENTTIPWRKMKEVPYRYMPKKKKKANTKLAKVRVIVENVFGRIKNRFESLVRKWPLKAGKGGTARERRGQGTDAHRATWLLLCWVNNVEALFGLGGCRKTSEWQEEADQVLTALDWDEDKAKRNKEKALKFARRWCPVMKGYQYPTGKQLNKEGRRWASTTDRKNSKWKRSPSVSSACSCSSCELEESSSSCSCSACC